MHDDMRRSLGRLVKLLPPDERLVLAFIIYRLDDVTAIAKRVHRMERMLGRLMKLQRSILNMEEEIEMAGPKTQEVINALVEESKRNVSATNSALNMLHTLLDQAEENKDDPTALQAVLDTFRANDEALAAASTTGTASAADPVGVPAPVNPVTEEPNGDDHAPLEPTGPSVSGANAGEGGNATSSDPASAGADTPASSNSDAVRAARHGGAKSRAAATKASRKH
jgi:hypothetical protein